MSRKDVAHRARALQTGADSHLFTQVSYCQRVCATTGIAVQRILMSALQDRFAQAQEDVNGLAERPGNNTIRKLYALYKQATQGETPPGTAGWLRLCPRRQVRCPERGQRSSAEDAMQQYIDLVASLRRRTPIWSLDIASTGARRNEWPAGFRSTLRQAALLTSSDGESKLPANVLVYAARLCPLLTLA